MAGSFEAAEGRARAVVAAREGVWRCDRWPLTGWEGRYYAALAAVSRGRGAAVLAELEGLIAELEHLTCEDRLLQLRARVIRAGVLIDEGRPAEAEADAVLRVLTRTMYVTDVWELELDALVRMGQALCALGRHEEAETIARGHLPRTDGYLLNDMRLLLLHSLSGQGRHEEALAEPYRHSPEPFPAYAGAHELATAVALHGLGCHKEAEEEARRALTACERHLHPTHPRVGEIRALLAAIAPA
ncbi:tetratricopeptide repeat protein [Streptomyces yangpuensis]